MTMRIASRYVSRRLSSGGKVLSEEEKAAENVYIKKMEKDKLEKIAHKEAKAEAAAAGSGGGPVADAKPSGHSTSGASTEKLSTDKYRNYGVLAGTITILGAVGWYLKASKKKPEVQD
ncbi:hypothetical protein SAY87_001849 [Trapa incisa]|uniref:Uncharacterized protein n=2 Tax=Trapa TaxID=22665 RepID=A0AAN7QEV9_TRANT|nr:hypothetical protein SAY87_001849 [Trapa incisa]KAK4765691.1 hypothetical protein SAY86_026781 [Trapa natans]